MPGRLRRSRREVLGEKQWRSLEERGSAQLEQPKLTRSRTYESSCKETEQAATGRQGPPSPSLSKQDSSYRRVFGGLAEQDALLGCFSCAWQREMPYHGRLYVSSRHICFHSSLLLKDIKAVVPVASISALKKTNTALLVPNAISIRTAKGEKFLFVALRQREATYQLLRSVCKHLQDSGQSPRDSASWEETLGKSQMSSQSAPEQSTPEPNSLQEALDEPNLRSRATPRRALCLGHCTLVPDKPPAELSQHHHHHLPAAHGGLAAVLGVHRPAHRGAGAAVVLRRGWARPQPVTAVQDNVRPPRTMTRAPARASLAFWGRAVTKCLPAPHHAWDTHRLRLHLSCLPTLSSSRRDPGSCWWGREQGISWSQHQPQPALPAQREQREGTSPQQGRGTENRIIY